MNHCRKLPLLRIALAAIGLGCPEASAYLGSFEETDGYRVPANGQISTLNFPGDARFYLNNVVSNGFTGIVPPGAFPNNLGDGTHGHDLSRYNAGQYGAANSGPGGTAVDIADNSGLWQALQGGRLDEDANAPFYTDTIRDYVAVYRTFARTGNQVLNVYAGETDLSYRYSFDSRDFDGLSPTLTSAHLVEMEFWICPTDWDDTYGGNVLGMSFLDASNATALEIGYTGSNQFQFRLPGQSDWTTTAFNAGSSGWSRVALSIDTTNDLASLSIQAWSDSLGQLAAAPSALLTNVSIGSDIGALAGIRFDAEGGLLPDNSIAYKNYFDDFDFTVTASTSNVPEPAGAALVILGVTWLSRRRRVAW